MNDFSTFFKQITLYCLFICSFLSVVGCSRDSVKVTGNVIRVRGNQMPSPDLPNPAYPGFRTTVFFFEPALQSNARKAGMDGVFYDVGTRLAGKADTDAQGNFSLRLKPGRYSVLIGRDTLFYANIIDGQGYLHPVEVRKGEPNRIGLRADWDAKY